MLLGSQQVFAAVPALVRELLGITVSTTQVYRRCQAVAAALPPPELAPEAPERTPAPAAPPAAPAPTYAMVDGSMLFFDAGWQEVKVGRLFSATATTPLTTPPEWTMGASTYVAQRGPYAAFTARFEQLLPPQTAATGPVVFVTDGAVWLQQWLASRYPRATHILDYYHVHEKLAAAAVAAHAPPGWLDQQVQGLLAGQSRQVEAAVRALPGWADAPRTTLANYLENNHDRMRYAEFRAQGLMIGSGPIEAAHRTLLQVRMKRSGQRWSEAGGDRLIRLREVVQNHQFQRIIDLLRKANAKL